VIVGASAAATLPAALSAAVLVGAPFAGTTVAPLAETRPAATVTVGATQQPASAGFGPQEWALVAGAEARVLGAAVANDALRRRSGG
jgi:hypothetical protein